MTGPWPRGGAFGPEGLSVEGLGAGELAERFGTPLVVVDEEHVRERCRAFREAFGRSLWAVKAFPAGALIRIALEEGLGVLAATGGELDACLRAGARGSDVVYHGNNKSDEEIARAVDAGVSLVVVDNEAELERIAARASGAGVRQPVLLRVVPGIDVETHRFIATGMHDTKFGIPLAGGMALGALKRALALPALEVRGIHLHLGSQLLDPAPYRSAIDVALDFLAEARDAHGFEASVLDVGGGMGVRYTDEQPVEPAELAASIRTLVTEGCAARGLHEPELLVEPGRALTSNAAVTLYRVGAIKEVPGIRTFVAVDGGMSDNLRPALYDARYTVALAGRASDAPPAVVTIVGRHCESGDVLARDVELPGDLRSGDLLAFASTGAYEYAMASNYNKVGRPAVVVVRDGEARLALRRESSQDLARLEMAPPVSREAAAPAGVVVRPAKPSDARGMVSMITAVIEEQRFIRSERAWPARVVRRRFRRPWTTEGAELSAIADGRLIANLSIHRESHPVLRHVASLGMAVAADWRRKGVGAALMAEAFRWAAWAGIEKVTLSVYPGNEAALALYRRCGFVEEGRLARHSKKSYAYEDEILMAAWV